MWTLLVFLIIALAIRILVEQIFGMRARAYQRYTTPAERRAALKSEEQAAYHALRVGGRGRQGW
jgi:hypothetical protein